LDSLAIEQLHDELNSTMVAVFMNVQCYDVALDERSQGRMIRDWLRSSMGVFGCFGICVGFFCLAVWIMWQIMESMGPG
jgi:hypothetical protein